MGSVVGAPAIALRTSCSVKQVKGLAKHGVCAQLITMIGKRCSKLCFADRCIKSCGFDIGIVAQVGDGGLSLSGEHIERIGQIAAALVEIGVTIGAVGQVRERISEG